MTATSFASFSGTMFATLAKARQDYRAAQRATDAIEDSCQCARSCRCELRPAIRAAREAEREAQNTLAERETAWREYCAIRAM